MNWVVIRQQYKSVASLQFVTNSLKIELKIIKELNHLYLDVDKWNYFIYKQLVWLECRLSSYFSLLSSHSIISCGRFFFCKDRMQALRQLMGMSAWMRIFLIIFVIQTGILLYVFAPKLSSSNAAVSGDFTDPRLSETIQYLKGLKRQNNEIKQLIDEFLRWAFLSICIFQHSAVHFFYLYDISEIVSYEINLTSRFYV